MSEKIVLLIVLLEEIIRKASIGIKVDDVRAYAKNIVEAFLEISVDWQVEGTTQEYLLRAKERARETLNRINSYLIPESPALS